MLKTKNSGYKAIVIITLILLIAALVITALVAVKEDHLPSQIACLLEFAALIYAAYYILSGYSKNAAKYYKTYGFMIAGAFVFALAAITQATNDYFATLVVAIQLTIVLILTMIKDLGKKKSMGLCYAYLLVAVIGLALSFAGGLIAIGYAVVELIFAIVMTVMTVAKYIDKTARGTK